MYLGLYGAQRRNFCMHLDLLACLTWNEVPDDDVLITAILNDDYLKTLLRIQRFLLGLLVKLLQLNPNYSQINLRMDLLELLLGVEL